MYPDEFWVDIVYEPPYDDDEFWKGFDLIHYHRQIGQNYEMSKMVARKLTQWGIPHVMDIDDHWLPTTDHPAYAIIKQNKIDKQIVENLRLASHVTTTTEEFVSEIKKVGQPNVSIYPNAIDHEEKQYVPVPTESDKVRVGWLGGSSHIGDLEILNNVFGRLHNDRPGKLQTVLCGYDLRGTMTEMDQKTKKQTQRPILPHESVWYKYEKIFTDNYNIVDGEYKKELLNFKKKKISGDLNSSYRRVWTKPITSYASSYNFFDVSIAPLKEHKFNRVKSQLKVIEAGFHKKALIVQDYGPYRVDCINAFEKGGGINPNGNCLMVDTTKNHKQWYKHIRRLIDNPELVKDLGQKLYETVYPKYALKTVTETRVEFYRELIKKS